MNRFDLTHRVAVVTGGTGTLGLAMARGLAEAGAKMVLLSRREQQSVSGDGRCGDILDCVLFTNLGFANAKQCLLVAEVDFDVPTHDVSLEEGWGVCVWVSADEKGGLSVKVFAGRRDSVAQRGNDDELEVVSSAGCPPA